MCVKKILRVVYTQDLKQHQLGYQAQAKEAGYDVKVTQSAFQGNAKALIKGENEGFIKLVVDKKYGEVLGAFIVGTTCYDIIGELLVSKHQRVRFMNFQIIQPHPALLEAIGESADAFLILQFICSFKLYDL